MSVTIAQIQVATAQHFGLSLQQMLGERQDREVVRPRQVAMWISYEQGKSLTQIGRSFKRDHTTVFSGIRRVESIIRGDSSRRLEQGYISNAIAKILNEVSVDKVVDNKAISRPAAMINSCALGQKES